MPSNNNSLAVFDLDDTLININSQYIFTVSFLKKHSLCKYFIFRLFMIKVIYKISALIFKTDIRRILSFLFLKKYKKWELKEYAKEIFSDHSIVNNDIHCLLNNLRSKGYVLILATATPDFIAEVFQEIFSFNDFISTVRSDGKVILDVKGKKPEFLKNKFPDTNFSLFISDNEEDINDLFDTYVYVKQGNLFKKTSINELKLCI